MPNSLVEIKINRSNRAIFAQAVSDGKTIAGKLYRFKGKGEAPVAQAHSFGEDFGQKLVKLAVRCKIRFDRRTHLYHGRVAAFAEGLRKAGLKF